MVKKHPGDVSRDASGAGDVSLLGEDGDDQIALVRFGRGAGGSLFVPNRMRRRLSPRALRIAARIQYAAAQREHYLDEIDRLVPELKAAGASWAVVGFFTNMTAAGAQKRWDGDDAGGQAPGD